MLSVTPPGLRYFFNIPGAASADALLPPASVLTPLPGLIFRSPEARHRDEIKIFYLPAYSPELNPDELVNGDLKPGVGQREPAANKEELGMQIVEHMEETKSNPEKVKNFFREASVRYASNNHVLLPEQ